MVIKQTIKMRFEQYQEEVKRTCPDKGEFEGNPIILNSIHMVLGMTSEIYEYNGAVDKVNLAEEITDKVWYACNYANIRGIVLTSTIRDKTHIPFGRPAAAVLQLLDSAMGQFINALSELIDYDKKEFAYSKKWPVEVQVRRALLINMIISALDDLYYYNEINGEQAMANNIAKLYARFPADKGFNEDSANNRNLENERKQLEK